MELSSARKDAGYVSSSPVTTMTISSHIHESDYFVYARKEIGTLNSVKFPSPSIHYSFHCTCLYAAWPNLAVKRLLHDLSIWQGILCSD